MLFENNIPKSEVGSQNEEYAIGKNSETAVSIFYKNSVLYADRIAISSATHQITYHVLNERTSALAAQLEQRGIRRGDVVAIRMQRSPDLIVALMGVLKAGAAFVCIDPTYPDARIHYMVQNSGAKCLLCDDSYEVEITDCVDISTLDLSTDPLHSSAHIAIRDITPADISYVIFTSGTTGNPKGSMIPHEGLVNMILHHKTIFAVAPEDRVLQFASISFDASVFEIFLALLTGASLVLITKETIYDREQFISYISDQRVTVSLLPPVFLASLERVSLGTMRILITGGEACNREDALHYSRSKTSDGKQVRFFNAYGPSEVSVIVSIHEVSAITSYEKYIPIGKPIQNIRFHVLDEQMKEVNRGETGELFVSGIGLAKGYINNPDLTAAAFITIPSQPNRRLYKTGDLVRELDNGEFVILGRKDSQVKILGHRIELSAIESVMNSLATVSSAYVMVREDAEGGKFLCAYFKATREISAVEMRSLLLDTLPAFMIPQYLIQVKEFALNQSGKIDKSKLPIPEDDGVEDDVFDSELAQTLASIWKNVLGVKHVHASDHFFTSGGHSLKAAEFVIRIYKALHIKLKVGDLYQTPVFADLVNLLKTSAGSLYHALQRAPIQTFYPLSSAQRRMYIVTMSEKSALSYNVSVVLEFKTEIPLAKITTSVAELIQRHEILRTRYLIVEEEVMQEVMPECEVEIITETISRDELPAKARAAVRAFDLSKAPLLRTHYYRIAEGGCAVVFDSHHIAVDGTSVGILVKEFIQSLENVEIQKPELHYKDYAVWENQHYYRPEYFSEHEHFWLSMYKELPGFSIPVDMEEGRNKKFTGARIDHNFNPEAITKVYQYLAAHNISLFQFFLSAYYLFLSRFTSSDDVVIGTAVANRNSEEVQNMPGMFVNTLALRLQLEEEWTFDELIHRVQALMLNCANHQEYPFEKLIERLGLVGAKGRVPLIDTTIVVQNVDFFTKSFSDELSCKYENYADTSKFAVSIFIIENNGTFSMQADFNTAIFKPETIALFVKSFTGIIDRFTGLLNTKIEDIRLVDNASMHKVQKMMENRDSINAIEFDF